MVQGENSSKSLDEDFEYERRSLSIRLIGGEGRGGRRAGPAGRARSLRDGSCFGEVGSAFVFNTRYALVDITVGPFLGDVPSWHETLTPRNNASLAKNDEERSNIGSLRRDGFGTKGAGVRRSGRREWGLLINW
ncbi:hypothetical protein EVAR_52172_1 [Eumeta japonica]|uniref:Uncharacterized protein n=1 Tax=Eumeta variegata TaxID=151549 RepID=A0A4C1YCK5_EUMVA|nr:hypothetical protein EVAR_52172_1 [Eumeta japonica]